MSKIDVDAAYAILMGFDFELKSDPLDEGDYAALLYVQESLSQIANALEKVESLKLDLNQEMTHIDREVTSSKLLLRILKNPHSYPATEVKAIVDNYTVVGLEDKIETIHSRFRELKLLDESLKSKVQHLKRLNTDIKHQSKVIEDQIYLSGLGKRKGSNLKTKMEQKPQFVPEIKDLTNDDVKRIISE